MFNERIAAGVLLAAIAVGLAISGCERGNGDGKIAITKDALADAIEGYVMEQAELGDGYFIVTDDITGEELKLTLDKVHRKRLARIGPDEYFACADFMATDGRVFDLDVFMKGTDKDNLEFSQFMVHKVEDKERYTWFEEEGVWKRKFIYEPEEHPREHPTEDPEEHPKDKREHPTEHPR